MVEALGGEGPGGSMGMGMGSSAQPETRWEACSWGAVLP